MEEKVEDSASRGLQGLEAAKFETGSGKGVRSDVERQDIVAVPLKQSLEVSGLATTNSGKEDVKTGRVLITTKEKPSPVPQAPPLLHWQLAPPIAQKRPGPANEIYQRGASEPTPVHRPQPQVLPQAVAPPIRPQPALMPLWPPQVILGPHRGGVPGQLSMMPPPPPSQQGHQHSQQLHMQQQKVTHAHLQQRPVQSVGVGSAQHQQAAERVALQQLMQRPALAMHPPQNQSNSTQQLSQQRQRVMHTQNPLNMPQQPIPRSHGPPHHHLQQMAAAQMLGRGPPMFAPGMTSGSQPMMSMPNFHELMAMQPAMMRGAVVHGAFPMLPHMAHMQIPAGMTPIRFVTRPNGPQIQGFWRPAFVPAQPPPLPVETTPSSKKEEKPVENALIIAIGDRKVRLVSEEDPTALYALCRRWLKNDMLRKEEPTVPQRRPIPLPKPLPLSAFASAPGPDDTCQPMEVDTEPSTSGQGQEDSGDKRVEDMSTEELLDSHLQRFRSVKKRLRDARAQRIARFKPRLAMLLPSGNMGKFESTQAEQLEPACTTAAA